MSAACYLVGYLSAASLGRFATTALVAARVRYAELPRNAVATARLVAVAHAARVNLFAVRAARSAVLRTRTAARSPVAVASNAATSHKVSVDCAAVAPTTWTVATAYAAVPVRNAKTTSVLISKQAAREPSLFPAAYRQQLVEWLLDFAFGVFCLWCTERALFFPFTLQ